MSDDVEISLDHSQSLHDIIQQNLMIVHIKGNL